MERQISLAEFDAFCRRTLADQVMMNEPDDSMSYYLSEASPAFDAMMRANGLYIDGDQVHFELERLAFIQGEAASVISEHDLGSVPLVWRDYGLRGDDDVDYNGGYIQIFIEALRAFVKWKDEEKQA